MGNPAALAKLDTAPAIRLQDLSPAGIIELSQKQRDECYAVAERQLWYDFAAWLEAEHPEALKIVRKGRDNQNQQERELLDSYLDDFLPAFALEVGPRAGWSETVKLKIVAWTDSGQIDKSRAWRQALDSHDECIMKNGTPRIRFSQWHKNGRNQLVDECTIMQRQLRKDNLDSFEDICRIVESKREAWTKLDDNLPHLKQAYYGNEYPKVRQIIKEFAERKMKPAAFVTRLLCLYYKVTEPHALDVALSPKRLARPRKR